MFEFSWPWLFILLPLPLLLLLLKPAVNNAHTRLRIPSFAKHNLTSQSVEAHARRLTPFEWVIWLLLVIAAANPTWLDDPISMPNEGRDIMLAVDLSGSMTEQDMAYNGQYVDRLTMVKAVLTDFIEQRQGDRLGLILFGDTAFLQTPLTRDVKTVSKMLKIKTEAIIQV